MTPARPALLSARARERHSRENESISVQPVRVLGVEAHELVEEDVGDGGHAHRGTGVTGVSLRGGIDLDGKIVISIEQTSKTVSIEV